MAYQNVPESACKEFEEKVVLYYFGDCAAPESEQVERHLRECRACARFLEDLRAVLPKTTQTKELPEAYWDRYRAEMIEKLDAADQRSSWWREWFSFLRPWPVPAVVTGIVLILTLTLAYTRGMWRSPRGLARNGETVPQEILGDPGQLDFFEAMDLLESLQLLESLEKTSSARNQVRRL